MYAPGKTDTILDVEGILVGQAEDPQGLTGLSVVLAPQGAAAGVDVRGGGSGTRETTLMDPRTAVEAVHAVVLSGGSAFGLDAAGGVMAWLEEQGYGFDAGVTKVPLVAQAILFDLGIGDHRARPDQAMARRACQAASSDGTLLRQGNYGAGCGATIGKLLNGPGAMKSGIGSASLRLDNGFTVGALVAVNALGDVYEEGRIIAGLRDPQKGGFLNSSRLLLEQAKSLSFAQGKNTTIGIIATNGRFHKSQCGKIAAMGQNGLARAIRPVHTTVDGDTLFALATGKMEASLDAAGEMAALTVERAILKAVKAARGLGPELPAWQDLQGKKP